MSQSEPVPRYMLKTELFRLETTLDSGQFFRRRKMSDGDFLVVTHGSPFLARPAGDGIEIEGMPPDFVRDFLGLDHDVREIERSLRRDPKLHAALDAASGLRILRQDPWECLVSFVTSTASNIPRISANLDRLCHALGRPVAIGGRAWSAMPRPPALVSEEFLRRLGFGYRANYLVTIAQEVEAGVLNDIHRLPTAEARELLCSLPGVAEKVADCVLLFAHERLDVFPVDTWIRKVMTETYFSGKRPRGGDDAIRKFAADAFGPHAGYAQQYLYVWSRRRNK